MHISIKMYGVNILVPRSCGVDALKYVLNHDHSHRGDYNTLMVTPGYIKHYWFIKIVPTAVCKHYMVCFLLVTE